MSKEYNIFSESDFDEMVSKCIKYFIQRKRDGKTFQKIKIILKRYVQPKTSAQHRYYWACIGEMKKAFNEVGYIYNGDEIHEFIKIESGFTKTIELPNGKTSTITKSIADASDDVNIENIGFLINFIKDWTLLNLNYEIKEQQC